MKTLVELIPGPKGPGWVNCWPVGPKSNLHTIAPEHWNQFQRGASPREATNISERPEISSWLQERRLEQHQGLLPERRELRE